MTLRRGQDWPSDMVSGNGTLSSVHGQPVVPGGGGGRSRNLGQCITNFPLPLRPDDEHLHVSQLKRMSLPAGYGDEFETMRLSWRSPRVNDAQRENRTTV